MSNDIDMYTKCVDGRKGCRGTPMTLLVLCVKFLPLNRCFTMGERPEEFSDSRSGIMRVHGTRTHLRHDITRIGTLKHVDWEMSSKDKYTDRLRVG